MGRWSWIPVLGQDGVGSTPYLNAATSCQGRKWSVGPSPWGAGGTHRQQPQWESWALLAPLAGSPWVCQRPAPRLRW